MLVSWAGFELPPQSSTWGDAMQAVMSAQKDDLEPDEVDAHTWKIFETMAFLLIPKVNR